MERFFSQSLYFANKVDKMCALEISFASKCKHSFPIFDERRCASLTTHELCIRIAVWHRNPQQHNVQRTGHGALKG